MRVNSRVLCCAAFLLLFGCDQTVRAAIAINQITDINNTGGGFGNVNVFSNPPIGVNDTGVFMNNDVTVYTLTGPTAANGAGLSVGISNGENGITSTNNGVNLDANNTTPVNSIFTTIGNLSGKLENGNAVRLSMWMRQDPTNPVTKQPSVEPVVKIELWKEALSGFADFNAVAFPGAGDRIWDTDQNASNAVFTGFNQSQASWVDMNNNGVIASGRPVAVSLVTEEWRRVEATLIVDDDPLDDGLGWSIGSEFFDVTAVEEIRAVMYVGDFAGTDLTAGGSFFIDNLMVEVFANQAAMLATPNPNTAPVESVGVPGDYNENEVVDAADYTVWRDNFGSATALPNDPSAGVAADDYDRWKANFGDTLPGAGGLSSGAVPEPSTLVLVSLAMAAAGFGRRRSY
jgi:hypothetical protein